MQSALEADPAKVPKLLFARTAPMTRLRQLVPHSTPYINNPTGTHLCCCAARRGVGAPPISAISPLTSLAASTAWGVRLVLVHGSRPQIEERRARRGISSHYHNDCAIYDKRLLWAVCNGLRWQVCASLIRGTTLYCPYRLPGGLKTARGQTVISSRPNPYGDGRTAAGFSSHR